MKIEKKKRKNGGDYKSHLKERRISNLATSRRDGVDCQLLLAVEVVFEIRPNLHMHDIINRREEKTCHFRTTTRGDLSCT